MTAAITPDLYVRAQQLDGWIDGGYARRAAGYHIGCVYRDRASAEAESDAYTVDAYPIILPLVEAMVGDTRPLSVCALRWDGHATDDEIIEAERLGWLSQQQEKGMRDRYYILDGHA